MAESEEEQEFVGFTYGLSSQTVKDEAEQQAKKNQALQSMQKLLEQSEKVSRYCSEKINKENCHSKSKDVLGAAATHPPAVAKEKLLDELRYFVGSLRPYQIDGVIWLKKLFEHGVSGILADEMGLGKTIQVIALLCHLVEKKVPGPFLIIVPLSTVPNWVSEFKKFAPKIPVVVYHGSDRREVHHKLSKNFILGDDNKVKPVVLTTAHVVRVDRHAFNGVWQYLIIDEGHLIKNPEAQISRQVRNIICRNKLLLTGTPLQNDLRELWSLLNFIMPNIFKNMQTFSSLLCLTDLEDKKKIIKEEQNTNIISTMHRVLEPFLLRRLKSEVLGELLPKKDVLIYCPLSSLQKRLYTGVMRRKIENAYEDEEPPVDCSGPAPKRKCTNNVSYDKYFHAGSNEVETFYTSDVESNVLPLDLPEEEIIEKVVTRFTMTSYLSMFKKIIAHPYLVQCPISLEGKIKKMVVDERLLTQSGKLLVLDAMLPKLKARGHKILLFSTLTMMLDIVEELMIMRGYAYCRLDGSMQINQRQQQVDEFNDDPDVFVFLLSTRAGGLGLNLVSADTVIFYDRDWNPQTDLQATDRCHRIGQTKPVMVYSLITKNTIDEDIVQRGEMKRRLEKMFIKNGKFKRIFSARDKVDLLELEKILEGDVASVHSNGFLYTDEELDALLDRKDLYGQLDEEQFCDA